MPKILKQDHQVIVTLEDDGLVKKVVFGLNSSRLRKDISPEEMVDREIHALESLSSVKGIQKFVKRDSPNSFYSEYIPGKSLFDEKQKLDKDYFDELANIVGECNNRGVYRIGQNRRDFLIMEDGKPAIIDFGNVLFETDTLVMVPGVVEGIKLWSYLRRVDLRMRYASH